MGIVKNSFRVSRPDGDLSPGSRGTVSTEEDDDEVRTRSSASESQTGSEVSEADSGMGSDEFDLSELGEAGTEFCQVGKQSCSIPLELYDLPDLSLVLSLETWNDCLSEEERFALAENLPDMDQETFARTLKELFSGQNFHFGSPLADFFSQLKGGLCDPRIVLYRRTLNFFQWREHYHLLRKYQNSMVGSIYRIRGAWQNCFGYGIEERLRLLNILKSRRPLAYERDADMDSETDSESGNSGDRHWNKRYMDQRFRPSFDIMPRGSGMPLEQVKFGKENTKGVLKVAAPKSSAQKEYIGAVGRYPLAPKYGADMKSRQSLPLLASTGQEPVAGYDLGAVHRSRHQMNGDVDDSEEPGYEIGVQRARASSLKTGKKHEYLKRYDRGTFDGEDPECYGELPYYQGRSRNADQGVTIASYDPQSLDSRKKTKHSEKEWMYPVRDRAQHQELKGAHIDWSAGGQHLRRNKMYEEAMSLDHSVKSDDWNIRGKKWKAGHEYKTSKAKLVYDSKVKSYKSLPAATGDSYFHSDLKAKTSGGKIKNKSVQYEGMGIDYSRGSTAFGQSEETESDSSDQVEEDEDVDPLARKLGYPGGAMEFRQSRAVKSVSDSRKLNKLAKLDKKEFSRFPIPEGEPYTTKGKQKGKKALEPNYLHDIKLMKKSRGPQPSQKLLKSYNAEKKHKGMVDLDHVLQQPIYTHDYRSGLLDEHVEDFDGSPKLVGSQMRSNRTGSRNQISDALTVEVKSLDTLVGCNSVTKKQKGKVDTMSLDDGSESLYPQPSPKQQIDDTIVMKKKGKRKADAGADSLTVETPDSVIPEKESADVEPESKVQKKPFTLITPTIHTGFSFSIVHLLSAVRKAMITPNAEDSAIIGNHLDKDGGRPKQNREEQTKMLQVANGTNISHSLENMDVHSSEHAVQNNLPSLTVQEIVSRVRSNPGDPYILETQEPLQDLVRGVLKIFLSKTAPLGAKGWKPLVLYEKSNKSWKWVGPVPFNSSDNDTVEEETSSEAWDIPHKMLVKLVDAFANWLKSGQETLQQIGSLPAPPASLLSTLDEKERFKDLRAQKSLNTISPSSDEVRAYFRKEELLRYSVPDRAFSYTAADGKKSIVAPLRRGGGKPTSKARDHFMLKPDRPPHVTILCLVRDAAARLPGSIGTRADVCTLIRDSQYIVEDVSDAQVNQVVSGALDRLHYERDPCVQFDGDRKLWVYLHRDREEEDFEDDGTSSTKKWKRQRKDATDQPDMVAVNDVSYHASGDPAAGTSSAGYDYDPDLNVDSTSAKLGEKTQLVYSNSRPSSENIQSYVDSVTGNRNRGNSVSWEALGLNPLRENKMVCQENSTNEDFDDEAFTREKPAGLFSTSLL